MYAPEAAWQAAASCGRPASVQIAIFIIPFAGDGKKQRRPMIGRLCFGIHFFSAVQWQESHPCRLILSAHGPNEGVIGRPGPGVY